MELTIIGSSGSVSGPDNPASCYLLSHGGAHLLLDLGPGGFGGLWSILDPRELTAITLSHLHADHCLDLCAYNVAARYSPSARWPSITVYAPAGAEERMSRAYEPMGEPSETAEWATDFVAWQGFQQIGPFAVHTIPARHTTTAFSLRVEAGGSSLVYSGDTGPNPELIELATGADLLLAEASFTHREDLPVDVHLSARQAAEHAQAAGVRRLVLTHIPPWFSPENAYDEARPHFTGELHCARPGMRLSVDGASADDLGIESLGVDAAR